MFLRLGSGRRSLEQRGPGPGPAPGSAARGGRRVDGAACRTARGIWTMPAVPGNAEAVRLADALDGTTATSPSSAGLALDWLPRAALQTHSIRK